MTGEIKQKHSGYGIAALVVSAPIWIYVILLLLCWHPLVDFLTMDQCSDSDFRACALKKLYGPILELILLIILAIVPLLIYSISATLGVFGYMQPNRKKTLTVAALISNAASVVFGLLGMFILAVLSEMKLI